MLKTMSCECVIFIAGLQLTCLCRPLRMVCLTRRHMLGALLFPVGASSDGSKSC